MDRAVPATIRQLIGGAVVCEPYRLCLCSAPFSAGLMLVCVQRTLLSNHFQYFPFFPTIYSYSRFISI